QQAEMLAVHARDLLDTMQVYPSLREATADCGWVIGTTCRPGLYRAGAEPPRALAPRILAAAAVNRVALVFGPETHGLVNADLRLCHQLITIPTDPGYPSLNVAQAVVLCCYELFVAAHEEELLPSRQLATAAQQELMYEKLKQAFLKIGFLHPDNPEHIMFAFRRIFGRAGLEERDVRILLGLARQIDWYASGGWRACEGGQPAGK
ncbi:MAG: RNA methyltransferase, partial [Candidatus Binatia bacterium]|nr:RNA methyltransferase [Candidatus Binatia bacterium]